MFVLGLPEGGLLSKTARPFDHAQGKLFHNFPMSEKNPLEKTHSD